MKTILFAMFLLPTLLFAQGPRGSFSSKDFALKGGIEIVLKSGEKIPCKEKVDGTKIGKTDIDYKDVDYIRLIKAGGWGWKSADETIYKYIIVKNKPLLVRVLIESPKLSFYLERPVMTGGGYAGNVRQPDSGKYTVYVKKYTEEKLHKLYYTRVNSFVPKAKELNIGKGISNILSDCPRLIQYQKDKNMKSLLSFVSIAYLYNENNCNEATPEEMAVDKKAIEELSK